MNRQRQRQSIYPILEILLAAGLFGASAPLAKVLLGQIEPIPMAAFLYLGSGIGLYIFGLLQRLMRHSTGKGAGIGGEVHLTSEVRVTGEARLTAGDMPWLAGAVLAGGVLAPIILMFSLRNTPAATASLLLNFEGVATTLIATLIFRENGGRHIWIAIACITAASTLLSWDGSGDWGFSGGALGVMAACVLWGIDNNFTRNISAKNPFTIVTVKGLAAGSFSLLLALLLGNELPQPGIAAGAMALGCLCYGFSIVLFVLAMRELGAARTSAFYGTAPFIGAVLSFVLFRELPGALFIAAIPIMLAGTVFLLKEEHIHEHYHEAVEHEHRHCHYDGHHVHSHGEACGEKTWHSHRHIHEELIHEHSHNPDIHHRHVHQ